MKIKIVQLTPGAGAMYCGNCLRDNTLVTHWNRLGHQACMVPFYLPLTLDEPDQSEHVPVVLPAKSAFPELSRMLGNLHVRSGLGAGIESPRRLLRPGLPQNRTCGHYRIRLFVIFLCYRGSCSYHFPLKILWTIFGVGSEYLARISWNFSHTKFRLLFRRLLKEKSTRLRWSRQ